MDKPGEARVCKWGVAPFDKETFVNALMQEHKTNPEKIVQFAMLALDELAAYNKGKRDMLDEIQEEIEHYKNVSKQIDDKFNQDKAELIKQYDLMKSLN